MQKKILIADDQKEIRDLYKERLQFEPFDVVFAEDGQQAIDLIKKHKPILALLDIMMPEKTGMEVLEEIKKDKECANIIIGMLTVLDDETIRNKAFDLGAKYYLVKSRIMPGEIVDIIKKEVSDFYS